MSLKGSRRPSAVCAWVLLARQTATDLARSTARSVLGKCADARRNAWEATLRMHRACSGTKRLAAHETVHSSSATLTESPRTWRNQCAEDVDAGEATIVTAGAWVVLAAVMGRVVATGLFSSDAAAGKGS